MLFLLCTTYTGSSEEDKRRVSVGSASVTSTKRPIYITSSRDNILAESSIQEIADSGGDVC